MNDVSKGLNLIVLALEFHIALVAVWLLIILKNKTKKIQMKAEILGENSSKWKKTEIPPHHISAVQTC